MERKYQILIAKYSKVWLSKKINMSYATFLKNEKNNSWSCGDIYMIEELYNKYISL